MLPPVPTLTRQVTDVNFFRSNLGGIIKKCISLFRSNGTYKSSTDDVKTRVAAIVIIEDLSSSLQGEVNVLSDDLFNELGKCLTDVQQV